MPARPLFWLTVFFMLGILADAQVGDVLPVQTHYFALTALIPIVFMAVALRLRLRMAPLAIPALLFVIFGM